MGSRRAGGIGSSIVAAAAVLAATSAGARAQNGYSADPFWPYNSQYIPYANPIGPGGSPEGGLGGGSLNAREGVRGANRFQDYLEEMQGTAGGPGRNLSDRSSVGMPYYRSAVDPAYQVRGRGIRQYTPNARSSESFEEAQQRVSDVYFRYSSERDPARRAQLWREYRGARREATMALSGPARGRSSGRALDPTARRATTATGRGARSGAGAANAPRSGRTSRARLEDEEYGRPPEVPFTVRGRRAVGASSTPAPASRRGARPSDATGRSRGLDRFGTGDDGPAPRPRGLAPQPPSARSPAGDPSAMAPRTNPDAEPGIP